MSDLNVDFLLFDVFGTVADWRTNVLAEIKNINKRYSLQDNGDWEYDFAQDWREGYFDYARKWVAGEPTNVAIINRQLLDKLIDTPGSRWSFLKPHLDAKERDNLNAVWQQLGVWPDVTEGLHLLKKKIAVVAFSNGFVGMQVGLARKYDLPWDAVFSAELFNSYKPNLEAYTAAASHLAVPPERCAMVAAHLWDLRAAAKVGMKTIYVPRLDEDREAEAELGVVKSKAEGGEVDLVAKDFIELSKLFK